MPVRRLVGRGVAVLCLLAAIGGRAQAVCQASAVASLPGFDPSGSSPTFPLAPVAAPSAGAAVANEGLAERLSDVLIFDNGTAPNCFTLNSVITLVYNLPLQNLPAQNTAPAANFDIFDSSGGAGLAVSATYQVADAATTITITVKSAGSAGNLLTGSSGAALRVKNLRGDMSGLAPGIDVAVTLAATAGMVNPGLTLGNVLRSIAPGAAITTGQGAQNSGGGLSTAATFSFSEGFGTALRTAAAASAQVYSDIATNATSLVLDVGNSLPVGITLTFPAQITTSGATGASFTLRGGSTCSGPSSCVVIYDTSANGAGLASLTLRTAAAPNSGASGTPAVGVQIGTVSGAGTVTLHAFLGPAAAAASGNDDANPAAVPRYVSKNTAGGVTRHILSGTWFTVQPTTPLVTLSQTSLSFADQDVGTVSTAQSVILTNASPLALSIASITSSTADFQVSHDCGTAVAGLTSCNIHVLFVPTQAGPRGAQISIVDNAPGSPHAISASGNGITVVPAPTLLSMTPHQAPAGAGPLSVLLSGANFQLNSVAQWNGTPLNTVVNSATSLFALIGTAQLAATGVAVVTVVTPAPGGGTSNALAFAIGNSPLPAMPHLYYLPHAVSGGGYVTKITVINLSNSANQVVVTFLTPGGESAQTGNYPVAAGGTLRVATPETERFAPLQTRWVVVGAQANVAVNLFFEYIETPGSRRVVNSVGFTDSAPLTEFSVPVEFEPRASDTPIGRTVGLALANTTAGTNRVALQLVDAVGNVLASAVLTLPAFGQTAVALDALPEFAAALPHANFVGSITGLASGAVAVIALADDFGPFAATPAVPGRAR